MKKILVFAGLLCLILSARLAVAGETRPIAITPPDKVRVSGDLEARMKLAVKCLDRATTTELWNGFTTGMWGADWPGRTLEAYSRVSMSLGQTASPRYDEVAGGLLAHQSPDGAFHIGKGNSPDEIGNGFWFGNARGMMGLLWAFEYKQDPKYLAAAKKLGEYYLAHYFEKNQQGAPSSFWWVATEALCYLYQKSGDEKVLDEAIKIAETIPALNLDGQHTHSYILSLRGMVQIYEKKPNEKMMAFVLDQYKKVRDVILWPGGGIVEHVASEKSFQANYWCDEGCSICDWIGLNMDLWRVTRDRAYMDMVERGALNHFLFDQDEGGGFCGDRGVDFVREGLPWTYCCCMHGTRTLSELTQYIAMTDGKDIFVNLYYPGAVELKAAGETIKLALATAYPKAGEVSLTLAPEKTVRMTLYLRVPAWSKVPSAEVNGEKIVPTLNKGYLAIERAWAPGDTVKVALALPLRTEKRNHFIGNVEPTDYTQVSLWKGPRQLVLNEEKNLQLWTMVAPRPALRHVYQIYEKMGLDRSAVGGPLAIGDKTYQKGIGTHATSEIVYALGGQFKTFMADIGVDKAAGGEGSVRFKVCVDGAMRMTDAVKVGVQASEGASTPALYGFMVASVTGKEPAKTIRVNVENAQVLRLAVDEALNGAVKDYADWAEARLIRADGSVVYLSDLPDDRKLGLPQNGLRLAMKEAAGGGSDTGLKLQCALGEKPVVAEFDYLADLGYGLIKHRPVLFSYFAPPSAR